jgi:glycerate 2-kinase
VLGDDPPGAARAVLARYDVETHLASADETAVWARINRALDAAPDEPPPVGVRSDHVIVGDVRQAALAALSQAVQLGFISHLLTAHLEGEAREVGRVAAALAKDAPPGRCLILGGETTVTLRGDGAGGATWRRRWRRRWRWTAGPTRRSPAWRRTARTVPPTRQGRW